MEKMWFLLYNGILVPLQYIFFQTARHFNKKISDGIRGRKGQTERIRQALASAATIQKRILFHCVSVGEWEQALPVISRLKREMPNVFIIVDFFSPSGYLYVKEHPDVDLKVYLPFDSYFRARLFLRLIKPDLFIVVKHDIWPNHLYAAKHLRIPAILIDANLPASSRRIAPLVAQFNRSVYDEFQYIFPVSEQDKERFLKIFLYPDRLFVTGDTRYDQVFNRGQKALSSPPLMIFSHTGIVFIAGSIWPADEKHIIPAVIELHKKYPDVNIILVPHEINEGHLSAIESEMQLASISSKRWSEISKTGSTPECVVIIDAVGLLVKLYSQSDIVYVGGSFSSGVHNVMEPGILGKPVIFGPRYTNSFEAGELIKCGGGFSVTNAQDIVTIVSQFIENPGERAEAGSRARQLIQQNLGAADKIIQYIKEFYDIIPKIHSN